MLQLMFDYVCCHRERSSRSRLPPSRVFITFLRWNQHQSLDSCLRWHRSNVTRSRRWNQFYRTSFIVQVEVNALSSNNVALMSLMLESSVNPLILFGQPMTDPYPPLFHPISHICRTSLVLHPLNGTHCLRFLDLPLKFPFLTTSWNLWSLKRPMS